MHRFLVTRGSAWRCVLPAAAAAFFMSPGLALAAPVYSASITGLPAVQNSPTPVDLIDNNGLAHAGSFLSGRADASGPARGLNNGIFGNASTNASATFDDILIQGPAGTTVPYTMHLPFHANMFQDWVSIHYGTLDDVATASNAADFRASLFSPASGTSEGRLILRNLSNFNSQAVISTELGGGGSVVATGQFPPFEEISQGGVTLFKNVPLGDGGFLNMTRTPVPRHQQERSVWRGGRHKQYGPCRAPRRGAAHRQCPSRRAAGADTRYVGDATATGSTDQNSFSGIDARQTFGPPLDGSPVFDLPPGFTAQSLSLNIINNAVPEARHAYPSGRGVASLLVFRRRNGFVKS